MSETKNVDTIRKALAAFIARDAEAYADCFAQDAELLLPQNLLNSSQGGGGKDTWILRRAPRLNGGGPLY